MGREGFREGLTIVAASVAAFAAGAAGLSVARASDHWESTAVVRAAAPGEALRSAAVARQALDAAGAGREEAGELLDHLSATRSGSEVAFTVRADEADAARRLAGSYARAWSEKGAVTQAEPAEPAPGRDTARAALTGAAIGLLAGLLLALLRERLDVRRTSSRSVAAGLGLGELGRVPEVPAGLEESYRQPALESPSGFAAKAYDRLAASVADAARAKAARVVAVCGTAADDHGEQVAAGLAAALTTDGGRVAVVELDQARPALRRQFALARRPGAAEVARGEATLDEALAQVPGMRGLSVLTAGTGPAPGREAAEDLLSALGKRFEMVVVAAPPLLVGGHAPPGVDALVLAVALRRTRRSRRPRLERVLAGLDIPVLGFVLMASAGADRPGAPLASVQRAPELAAGGHQARHHYRQEYQ
jgi:polysaccharide biosynthesis transport protein